MKKEIEVKILNIDRKDIRRKLKRLGAELVHKPVLMHEVYFEIPLKEQRFSSFRLRSGGGNTFLTYKLKKIDDNFNIADEYETAVGDFEMTKKILLLAGHKIFREREKIREEFFCGKIKIEIDEYPGMNPYVEIEAASKKEVESFLKKLGYSFADTTNQTATAVLKRAGLNPKRLFFAQ